MPDITKLFLESVESTELGKLLSQYLAERKRLPKIQQTALPNDTNASYTYNTVFGTELPSEGVISLDHSWKPSKTSTAVHELTHAAERELSAQYFTTPRAARLTDAYAQAFQKLRLSGKAGGPTLLADRIAPAWREANKDYRSSPAELSAFAVGNMSGSGVQPAPPHLDATLAQELSILADLAQRRKSK